LNLFRASKFDLKFFLSSVFLTLGKEVFAECQKNTRQRGFFAECKKHSTKKVFAECLTALGKDHLCRVPVPWHSRQSVGAWQSASFM
jgi:hypothetical protein